MANPITEFVAFVKTVVDPSALKNAVDYIQKTVGKAHGDVHVGGKLDLHGVEHIHEKLEGFTSKVKDASGKLREIIGNNKMLGEVAEHAAGGLEMLSGALSFILNPITLAVGATLSLVAALFGVGEGIAKVAEETEEFEKLGKIMGTAGGEAENLVTILGYYGIRQESAIQGIKMFSKNISDASLGIGRAKLILDKYGISYLDASGHMRETGKVLEDVLKLMKELNETGQRAKAVNLADRLGLGEEFLNAPDYDTEMVKKFRNEANELSGAEESDKALMGYMENVRTRAVVWRAFKDDLVSIWKKFAAEATEYFGPFMEWFTVAINDMRKFVVSNSGAIIKGLHAVSVVLIAIGGVLKFVWDVFRVLMSLIVMFGHAVYESVSIVWRLVESILGIGKANEGVSAGLSIWQRFMLLLSGLGEMFMHLPGMIHEQLDILNKEWSEYWDSMGETVDKFLESAFDPEKWKTWISRAWDEFKGVVSDVTTDLHMRLSGPANSNGILDGLSDWMNDTFSSNNAPSSAKQAPVDPLKTQAARDPDAVRAQQPGIVSTTNVTINQKNYGMDANAVGRKTASGISSGLSGNPHLAHAGRS